MGYESKYLTLKPIEPTEFEVIPGQEMVFCAKYDARMSEFFNTARKNLENEVKDGSFETVSMIYNNFKERLFTTMFNLIFENKKHDLFKFIIDNSDKLDEKEWNKLIKLTGKVNDVEMLSIIFENTFNINNNSISKCLEDACYEGFYEKSIVLMKKTSEGVKFTDTDTDKFGRIALLNEDLNIAKYMLNEKFFIVDIYIIGYSVDTDRECAFKLLLKYLPQKLIAELQKDLLDDNNFRYLGFFIEIFGKLSLRGDVFLNLCAEKGKFPMLELLMNKKCFKLSIRIRSNGFNEAVRHNNVKAVELFLRIKLRCSFLFDFTPLLIASGMGNDEIVKVLLDYDKFSMYSWTMYWSERKTITSGTSAIVLAAKLGRTNVIRVMCEHPKFENCRESRKALAVADMCSCCASILKEHGIRKEMGCLG